MEKEQIRVLLIEDDPGDADLLQEILDQDKDNPFVIDWVDRLQHGLQQLSQREFDLILSDLSLPDSHGSETFIKLSAAATHLPIVVLSGSSDEKIAVQALQEGAQDYLVKGEFDHKLIVRALSYAIERKQVQLALRQSEERYSLAAQGANDGLWDWDLESDKVYYSSRWKEMLGYADNEIGEAISEWFQRVHPNDIETLKEDLANHLDGKSSHLENEHRLRHKDGSYRWLLCRGIAVRGEKNKSKRIAGSQTDITRRRFAEERLRHEAMHDSLTGLPNRAFLIRQLNQALINTRQDGRRNFALLFLDLDRFKVINDSLGHLVGDQLLIEVSRRLKLCLRTGDILARFGGDEFVILLHTVSGLHDAQDVANRIQKKLALPFHLADQKLFTSVSIGIALNNREYREAVDLLRDADTAMYQAKYEGKARHAVFDTGQFEVVYDRWNLETDLRQAVEQNEFVVYYQPLISLETKEITGAEALLRWEHPKHGLLTPSRFIPLAEETGLILPISEWMLWVACRQLQSWHDLGFQSLRIAVNVSARQFRDQNLAQLVENVLRTTMIPPHSLELEITEIKSIENNVHAIGVLNQLKEMGVRISIDDFGLDTSLHSLNDLPLDSIKIDQSFIRDMTKEDVNKVAIIRAIIAMGHSLNLNVIAEGIESEEQLFLLHRQRCNEIQGFLYSQPVPPDMITKLLKNQGLYQLHIERNGPTVEPLIHAQANREVGYALVAEDLTILTYNSMIEKWVGQGSTSLIGQHLSNVFPELVGAETLIQEMIHDQMEDGFDIPRVYRKIHRSSAEALSGYYDLRVEPFQAAASTLLVIVTDVTEVAQLEFTLRHERNELRLLLSKYKKIEAGG